METKNVATAFEKYPAYKDSGVEWLGRIPEGWKKIRFKFLTKTQKGKLPKKIVTENIDNLPPYMSMEYLRGGEENQWVVDRDALIIIENEILLLWDGSNAGEFIKSKRGVISSTVAHISFKGIVKNFAWYYSKKIEIELRNKTIGMGIPHVNGEFLNNLLVVLPPIAEQTAIASFLDEKTAKIDRAIAQKERLIELLKERKQVIVQDAVTGKVNCLNWDLQDSPINGINATTTTRPMKPSGVEWIGDIPADWEVEKFKYTIKLRHGFQFRDKDFTEQGIKIVKITQLHPDGYLDLSKANFISEKRLSNFLHIQIKENDILMCLTGGTIGKIIKAKNIQEPLLQNYRVGQFSSINKNRMQDDYMFYLLSSKLINQQIKFDMSETGQPNIGMEDMKNMILVIPNTIYEQRQIVRYIEFQQKLTDSIIITHHHQIEKLKEYKAVLIDSAVTGKIKVV